MNEEEKKIQNRLGRLQPGVPVELRERMLQLREEIQISPRRKNRRPARRWQWALPSAAAAACVMVALNWGNSGSPENRGQANTGAPPMIAPSKFSMTDSGVLLRLVETEGGGLAADRSRDRRAIALNVF